MGNDWETLDTDNVLQRQRDQHEQTTSAGVGGYETPLGAPLRPVAPIPPYKSAKPKPKKKPKKQD
jgi:hypothetical protein